VAETPAVPGRLRQVEDEKMIVIDHEMYGQRTEFNSVEEAQEAVRACGDDFATTEFRQTGEFIYDERRNVVGTVLHTFEIENEVAAESYAELNYAGSEWYVLNADGENINA